MAQFDVLIRGGMVIDGRRTPRFLADVGIRDGIIVKIGNLASSDATRVIDATGCNVAPGIIDTHTHYDSQVFWDPYCSTSGWHGVTTVIIGNCGFGFAPVAPENRDRAMLTMTRAEEVPMACMQQGMPWDWVSFPEFLASLERTPKSVNVLSLVPLNPLMAWVMGLDRAKSGVLPTDAEHAEMVRLLNEAMDAGAAGISAQRLGPMSPQRDYDGTPMITDVMHDETMLCLAKVLGERNEGVIQYNHNDVVALFGGDVEKADKMRRHIQEVARVSRRPVLVPGLGDEDRAFVQSSIEQGLRIYPVYPIAALGGSGGTSVVSVGEQAGGFDVAGDGWSHATSGTVDEVKAKLADPQVRERMRADLPLMQKVLGELSEWVLVRAATPELAQYEQTSLGRVAKAMGYNDCVDAFCDINIAEDLKTRWRRRTMVATPAGETRAHDGGEEESPVSSIIPTTLADFKKIADDPWGCPAGSDGGAHTKTITSAHFGTYYLIHYVRDRGWVSLEDAHWKLSCFPAFQAGLVDQRGTIVEGAPADVIVYDLEALEITEPVEEHDYPGGEWRLVDRPIGLHYVVVNGEVTMERGAQTNVASGKLLSPGRALVGV